MENRFKAAFDAKKEGQLMSEALESFGKGGADDTAAAPAKKAAAKKAAAKKVAPKKAAAKTSSVKTASNGKNRTTENNNKGKGTKKGKP